MERLSEIRKVVSVPLVLHGTSGVPDDAVRECVARGMCKVNYATDLRIAFSKGLKEYLAKDPESSTPRSTAPSAASTSRNMSRARSWSAAATARLKSETHITSQRERMSFGMSAPAFAAQMTRPPQNAEHSVGPCRYERKVKVANMGECRLISAGSGLRSGRW